LAYNFLLLLLEYLEFSFRLWCQKSKQQNNFEVREQTQIGEI